jgi:hypothetical protein
MDVPGAPGQQAVGRFGTQGGTATQSTGNPAGLDGVPLQRTGPQGEQGLTGSGTGTGGGGAAGGGASYQGTSQEEPPSATPPVGAGTQPALPRDPEAMRRELLDLRQRVSRLEGELEALRGTGGGGSAGTGATGGTTGSSNVQVQGPVTLAITTFDGRVVGVTPRHIDIVDTSDGSFYRLGINKQTKAFVGPRLDRIPVKQLTEGTPVRTSFALISTGDEQALNIVARPQRPQEQQQGPQQQRQEQRGPGQRMAVPPPSR